MPGPRTAPVPIFTEEPRTPCDICKQSHWYQYGVGWRCRQCHQSVGAAITRENMRRQQEREQADLAVRRKAVEDASLLKMFGRLTQ